MKKQKISFSICLFMLGAHPACADATDIRINEVVSSNNATIADEDGDYSDWIELHNTGSTAVDLTGWGLTDVPATPFKWVFPSISIAPDGYLMVWASNKNRTDPTGPMHTNFAVSAAGESLALTGPTGTTIELVPVPVLPANVSYGHKPDQETAWFYFEDPTPGAANTTPGYADLTTPPEFSHPGGFYTGAFPLEISTQPGWVIYYTRDGSDPDPSRVGAGSKPYRVTHAYEGPIPVASRTGEPNVFSMIPTTGVVLSWAPPWKAPAGEVYKATVIRAVARDPVTGRTSSSTTRTFFVDPDIHGRYGQLPVISVVSDYVNLFDNATGIYVPGVTHGGTFTEQNFTKDWKRPASVEYFESDGTTAFNGNYEISNQGSTSPGNPQKALNVIARAELGPEMIDYAVFAGSETKASKVASYKRILLRAWGSAVNWPVLFNDAYHQGLAATADQETEAYLPAVVFINGEYWGLHDIREHNKNSWYHQGRTGINRDDPGFDLLEGSGAIVDEGDAVHWNETMAFINSNPLSNDAAYDYVTTRIDVENFAEYLVHCCYTGKRTWPDQNEAKWRPRTPDGRWRWSQYDMDQGLNSFGAPEHDMIRQITYGSNGYGPHPLFVKLMKNPRFKSLFIDIYADWLNSRVLQSVELARFDAMKAELEPFIAEYGRRWPGVLKWSELGYGRNIILRRNSVRRTQLRNLFGLGSDRKVTLLADAGQGVIRCNHMIVDADTPGAADPPYPWTGLYFHYQPISLEAIPREGHRFVGWRVKVGGADLPPVSGGAPYYSRDPLIRLSLNAASSSILTSVEAVFEVIPIADLHVWTFEGGSDPLPPTFTIGGGALSITPLTSTSSVVSSPSQGFTTSHLRVNNPIGTIVQWALPTTGHQSPKLAFLTRRSGSGAGTQTLSYTLDGVSWTVFENYSVADADPQSKVFRFSGIPRAGDNPAFAVRIEFSEAGGGTAGNNRFDNVVLSGEVMPRSFIATIESTPATMVNVGVSPPDTNGESGGITSFTRSYGENSLINLTAPAASSGYQFLKWQMDGVDLATTPSVNARMDGHHTFTAVYLELAPSITRQPVDVAVAAGDTAVFHTEASGSGTLWYQWRFNGMDIPGANSSSHAVPDAGEDDVGAYDVVVSNSAGSVTSSHARLTIVTNALVNGSFEAGYTGWTHTGNQVVLQLPVSDPYVASDGIRIVVFNKGGTTPNAVLSQSIATIPGQAYQLRFDMGILAYNSKPQRLKVDLTGSSLLVSQTFTMIRSGSAVFRRETKTMDFKANSSKTTISFRDISEATDAVNMSLDQVMVVVGSIPPNRAPVASADAYATVAGTPLSVPSPGVLANDSDADADALAAVLEAGPGHGTLALNPDGGFIYSPEAGYTGGDGFTYRASDGSAVSSPVTVALTVNPAPSATLVNGSFEFGYTGWTYTGNQLVLELPVTDPYVASDGTRIVVFNKGGTTPNGVLSQTISTLPGQAYQLRFDMGILAYKSDPQRLKVDLTGSSPLLSQTFTMFRGGTAVFRSETKSMDFTANSSSTTIRFQDVSQATNSINLTLDNVRIDMVSAPAPAAAATAAWLDASVSAASGLGPPEVPRLSVIPGEAFIRMNASTAGTYALERSEDLVNWKRIDALELTGPGLVEFHDTSADPGWSRVFYRIALPDPEADP